MTQLRHFVCDPLSNQSHQNSIQNFIHFFHAKIECVEFCRNVVFRITLLELPDAKLGFLYKGRDTYSIVRIAPKLP